jgi:hypothetical protein
MIGPIYMDNHATTRPDPRVLEAMLPYLTTEYGNASSRTHAFGWRAEEAITRARGQVAKLLNADPKEILFTAGATESNNLALKGVMRFHKDKKNHLITCVTEHKCVLDSARHLEMEGIEVTYLPVQPNGLIDLAVLEAAITPKTALVSIMAANNEIGVVQPLAEIGALCRKAARRRAEGDETPSLPDLPILRDLPPEWGAKPVLCVTGRGPFDNAVAKMLIQLLEKHGLGGCVEDNAAVSSSNIVRLNNADVKVICLSYLALGSSPAHLRHSLKRIRRQIADATLIVGLWGRADDVNPEHLQTAAADFYVSSLREALRVCPDTLGRITKFSKHEPN